MKVPGIPIGLFPLGNLVASAIALRTLTHEEMIAGLRRHQSGDWGDLTEADKTENTSALTEGRRIMSLFTTVNGTPFWVCTEAESFNDDGLPS